MSCPPALFNPLVLASVPSSLFTTLTFSFAQAMQLAVTQAQSARVLVLNSSASIEHLAREWSSAMLGHINEWIEIWGEPSLALITFLASGPVQLLTGDVRALETLPMWSNAIVHFWRTVSFPRLNSMCFSSRIARTWLMSSPQYLSFQNQPHGSQTAFPLSSSRRLDSRT